MKKVYLSIVFSLLAVIGLQAQTTNFSDDFESYTVGGKLADQAGDPWTTWSNAPGGTEDPVISDLQAYAGSNSARVQSGNDCVLLLGDSVTGRYKVSFYMFIPSGKLGYYNLLADFAGSNSEWGTQTFFDAGGSGSIDAGVQGAATFTFAYDHWFLIENYVDLDNDWAEIFIGGDYMVGWQWTLGTFGNGVSNKLSAANFYAWDGSKSPQGTPEFFLDEMLYESMPLGDAPTNLTADVDYMTVSLAWDAPAEGTPDSYYVFRDGELLSIQSEVTYQDTLEQPGTYTYKVQAFYAANGLSQPAGPVDAEIAGGTDRNLVLVEIGTGAWCQFCPGSAMGADDLVEEGHPVAVIEYHNGDEFETTQSMDRIGYYNLSGYPTAWFDGGNAVAGGSQTESMYPTYAPIVDNRETDPSWFELELDVEVAARATDFDVSVTATKIYDYQGTNMSIFLVLTESNIPRNWFGMTEMDYVCREMYPGSDGTPTTFELDVPVAIDYSVSVPYELSNCELVAFVQDVDTKEVMQSTKVNLGQVVGMEEMGEQYTRIYPNPASDIVVVETASAMKHIRIYNISGQQVYELSLDQNKVDLNIDFLNPGMYLVELETENGSSMQKLTVR
ncbi:MAG: T9SS type A sorting domain-containing protein [Bacteroidales bacterium]|nr:T9SS type A sorting domain-containing protein [Bacteroidales bacterium]